MDQNETSNQISAKHISIFPRTKQHPHVPKRTLPDHAPSSEAKRRIQKYTKSVPVRDLRPRGGGASLRKEESNPWDRYQKIFKMKQAGPAHFVHSKDDTFSEMIIKEKTVHNKTWLSKISAISHRNIVPLREALYHNSTIYFVYDVLDVSLAQVFATPLGRLEAYEVAAFSYEILEGIDHIHNGMRLVHGEINSENILLSTDGSLKIANIGTSMLKGIDQKETQNDVWSLGQMIIECLEPSTFLERGNALVMNDWDPALMKFQISTKTKSAQELLQDDFLKLSPGPRCLKPFIRLARELGTKQVELVEERNGGN